MPRKPVVTKNLESTPTRLKTVAMGIALLMGISLTVGSVLWGKSDSGQIDVSATIVGSQGAVDENGVIIATPNTSNELAALPNGGLEAQGADSVPAPLPVPLPDLTTSSSTATSTATTTVEEGNLPSEGDESEDEIREEGATTGM